MEPKIISIDRAGLAVDPVLSQFMGFLARDIASHPERLQAIDPALVQRIQLLTGSIDIDVDACLSAVDE